MEKRKPHYKLAEVRAIVAYPENKPFTATALRGGLALGLTEGEMREVVLALSPRDFYKAMTTYDDNHAWQDVYHGMSPYADPVYIKITCHSDGRPPIIQFKAK